MAPERLEFIHLQLDLHPITDFGRVGEVSFLETLALNVRES